MDILGAFLLACFIALLIVAAVTFGFAIITVCVILTIVTALLIVTREMLRRWRFLRDAEPPKVIEGYYRDISNQHKDES
jgi:hypothetical protein